MNRKVWRTSKTVPVPVFEKSVEKSSYYGKSFLYNRMRVGIMYIIGFNFVCAKLRNNFQIESKFSTYFS